LAPLELKEDVTCEEQPKSNLNQNKYLDNGPSNW